MTACAQRRAAREHREAGSARPLRAARGDRRLGPLPGLRRGRVHHRSRHSCRRRIGHGSLISMSGILAGKRILVTGVLTESSIAFHAAKVAQNEGAEVILTGFGRLSLVERIAKRLPKPAPVIELDVTNQEHLDAPRRQDPRAPGRGRPPRRHRPLHRLRPAGRLQLPGGAVGGRGHRGAGLGVLLQVADHGLPAADGARRLGRRPHLRRADRLAEVRLDGRGQGGAGEHQPLPRA